MMQDNMSNIFGNKVMGKNNPERSRVRQVQKQQNVEQQEEGQRLEQDVNVQQNNNNSMFEGNVMGLENSKNFLSGKLKDLDGFKNYENRINKLLGKGAKMNETNDEEKSKMLMGSNDFNLISGFDSSDKTNKILGDIGSGSGMKNFSLDIGGFSNSNKKVNKVLGNIGDKKSTSNLFDKKLGQMGVGNRAFSGIDPNKEIKDSMNYIQGNSSKHLNKTFNMNGKNKSQYNKGYPDINNKFGVFQNINTNTSLNKNQKNEVFENPFGIANTRMEQQKGLPMFGDVDNDDVINALDCDPLDPTEQGERHKVLRYLDSDTFAKTPGRNMIRNSAYDSADIDGDGDVEVDANQDGVKNDKDLKYYQNMDPQDRIGLLTQEMINSDDENLKKRYASVIGKLEKSQRKREKEKVKSRKVEREQDRKDEKFEFKKEKQKGKQQTELEKAKLQYGTGLMKKEKDKERQIEKSKLQYGTDLEKAQIKSERDLEKARLENALERERLDVERSKNDIALWQSKIEAGQNMLGTLIGGSKMQGDVTGVMSTGGNLVQQDSRYLTGVGGGNMNNMSMLVGGNQPRQDFQNKVMSTVGQQSSGKPFMQKVQETIGGSGQVVQQTVSPQRTNAQPTQQTNINKRRSGTVTQPQQPQPQQVEQPEPTQNQVEENVEKENKSQTVQKSQPTPQTQTMNRQNNFGRRNMREQLRNINWDKVSPDEAEKIDPDYAEYLEKSDDETTYRRGPYNTD